MKKQDASGTYNVKETGELVNYDFEYDVIDSVQDAIDNLGEAKVMNTLQRMLKVDANNLAREKAKTTNGHSARVVLTEEQKAENKAKRKVDKSLLDMIKAKGLSLADLEGLG